MRQSLHALLGQLRRRHSLRTLGRAAWLALAAVALVLAGQRLWGWPAVLAAPAAAAVLLAGLIIALWPLGSVYRLARRMDRQLHLRDGMTTALEVGDRPAPPTRVGQALLADAGRTVDYLLRRVRARPALLPRDLAAFATLLLVIAGLALYLALGQPVASRPAWPLPARGGEPAAPPLDQPSAVLGPPPADPDSALEALADALRDEGAGRGIAESLDQGDADGAADQLRELADQVDELSPEGRSGLAGALREAADEVRGENPELAQALERAAGALESGTPADAAQALQELAGQIDALEPDEETAENPPQGGTGTAGGDGATPEPGQSSSAEEPGDEPAESGPPVSGEARANGEGSTRLGGGEQPLELETGGDEETAPFPRGSEPLELPTEPGEETSSNLTPARGTRDIWQAGADLLRYPWELRRVVEAYFTRPEP